MCVCVVGVVGGGMCVSACARVEDGFSKNESKQVCGYGPHIWTPGPALQALAAVWPSALALEVGKSPTEVTRGRHVPMSLPSAICEFASSSSPSWSFHWSLNRAALETGANMVIRTKDRARDPLSLLTLLALATPSIC